MAEQDLSFDRSLLGVAHPLGRFHVTEDMVRAFGEATGEPDRGGKGDAVPSPQEGDPALTAPPTFCTIFEFGTARPDIKLDFDGSGYVAGQAIDCGVAIKPGDTVEATIRLKDVYAKTGRSGKMVFAVWETTFVNQDGEVVAALRESVVRRPRPAP